MEYLTYYSWSKRSATIASLLTVMSCGSSDSTTTAPANASTTATMNLKIQTAETSAALRLGELVDIKRSKFALTGAGNLSFTPVSYKLWISTIVLQGDNNESNQFYTCDTSAEDCEVDFADTESIKALEAKLSSLPVAPGLYTKVWLSCSPDNDGYMKFKGSVTLADESTVYTANPDTNEGVPWTVDSTKYDTLKIGGLAGGCGLTMRLTKPLEIIQPEPATEDEEKEADATEAEAENEEVELGQTVTMTLFSNLKFAAYYGANISGGLGGCELEEGLTSGPGFCGAYPSVFPYFGETTPTVEYYHVANTRNDAESLTEEESNTLVKIILGGDAKPFWASFSTVYEENTPSYASADNAVGGYANAVTSFSVNSDSSLTIKSQDYGFSAFKREAHTGAVFGEGIENGAGTGVATEYNYRAFPFVP